MKEHAKNAIKHDFNVAGKTIPTMIVAALFLIGGGAAATLTVFGTASGTADIDQAVTVNGNSADDGSISSSYDLASSAGESNVYTAEVSNNLQEELTVGVSTGRSSPSPDSSVENSNANGDNAVQTNYYTVDELVAVDNAQSIDTDTEGVDEVTEDGDMTSEVVYLESEERAAVHAYGQTIEAVDSEDDPVAPSTSSSSAGAWFDVNGVSYSGTNDLVIDYTVGSDHSNQQGTTPDWVTYNVTYQGDSYYVSTFTANTESGNAFNMDGNAQAILDSDGNVVWESGDSDASVTPSDLQGSATVEDVKVSTGSGADDDTYVDIYYHGVSFDGTELFEPTSSDSFNSLILEPGSTQLVIENTLDLAAVPGQYTVNTDIAPQ